MKYFGITETGDPCYVPDWETRLREANIIVSKELTDEMIEKLVLFKNRIIFHHTVTGMGGSIFEPNVKDWFHEHVQFRKLLEAGFPIEHYVLRVDPIIPYYDEALGDLFKLFETWYKFIRYDYLYRKPIRCRVSILDGYNHVKERFREAGLPYVDEFVKFTAPDEKFKLIEQKLEYFKDKFEFESCAENKFTNDFIQSIGCASLKDLEILGLNPNDYMFVAPKRRITCQCLPKKQILGIKPGRCNHRCLYCFWKY